MYKKESRIYTRSLAEFLTLKGFKYLRIVQDLNNPRFLNWIFEDTPQLHKMIKEFNNKVK